MGWGGAGDHLSRTPKPTPSSSPCRGHRGSCHVAIPVPHPSPANHRLQEAPTAECIGLRGHGPGRAHPHALQAAGVPCPSPSAPVHRAGSSPGPSSPSGPLRSRETKAAVSQSGQGDLPSLTRALSFSKCLPQATWWPHYPTCPPPPPASSSCLALAVRCSLAFGSIRRCSPAGLRREGSGLRGLRPLPGRCPAPPSALPTSLHQGRRGSPELPESLSEGLKSVDCSWRRTSGGGSEEAEEDPPSWSPWL